MFEISKYLSRIQVESQMHRFYPMLLKSDYVVIPPVVFHTANNSIV
jgi:hypothetical protein